MTPKAEHPTLRRRLLLRLLGPILLLTAFWGWATHTIVLHFADLAYDRSLEDTAQTLAAQVRLENGVAIADLPDAARRMLVFDQVDSVYFSVVDTKGRMVVGNNNLPGPPSRVEGAGSHFYDGAFEGHALRLVEYDVEAGSPGEMLRVRIAETLLKREGLAREVLRWVLAAQLLFLAALALLVAQGVGLGIAPLKRVSDAIARRSQRDLSPIDEHGLPAEVLAQVHVINGLMQRLDKAFNAQRRFIADATHQLRTPITVLHTQSQLALLGADEGTMREAVARIDGGAARLARLANQLLNLSRADAALAQRFEPAPVDPAALVEDIVALQVPLALGRGIDVRVELPPGLPAVPGDRVLLGEALANVVDNAIRYTPAGGRVEVSAAVLGDRLCIRVADTGPGIADDELERVLHPFERGSATGGNGSGLGLAITNEVVAAHGGRLVLAAVSRRRGLSVTLELPVTGD